MLKVNYDTIKKNSSSQKIRRLDLKILKRDQGRTHEFVQGELK